MTGRKGKKRGKHAPPKEELPPTRTKLYLALVVTAIVISALIVVQSGVLNQSGDNNADKTAALQTFGSFKEKVNNHDGHGAIDLTTLRFLVPSSTSNELQNYFTAQFSNASLVFTASNVVAIYKTEMSAAQKTESESQIYDITNQSMDVYIDDRVDDYLLLTGTFSMTGIENPPFIEYFVMLEIGGSWYVLLGE